MIDLGATGSGGRQLMIRRHRATGELAYYRCHSAQLVPLNTLEKSGGPYRPRCKLRAL